MLVQAEKVEEKPPDADEVDPDDEDDVSLEEVEEIEEPEEVTLDSLVTQFIKGQSVFIISINLACHCEESCCIPPFYCLTL